MTSRVALRRVTLIALTVVLATVLGRAALAGTSEPCDCCSGGNGLGCNCAQCEENVCSADSFCCNVAWDEICDGNALRLCVCCLYGCEAEPGGGGGVPAMTSPGMLLAVLVLLGGSAFLLRRRRAGC